MNPTIRTTLDNLYVQDSEIQHHAYLSLLEQTEKPVDWAYDAWDEMVGNLGHKNNRVRSIAAQVLCNLAKSDPENRMSKDFPLLLAVTKDERFVTARHTLQSLWKVGMAGTDQRKMLVEGLRDRFKECASEKNSTLIRYDIIQSLKDLHQAVREDDIRETAWEWIEMEEDLKYRKKYASVWRADPIDKG